MNRPTSMVGLDGETIWPLRLQSIRIGVHRGSDRRLSALPILFIVSRLMGRRQEPVPVKCGLRFMLANTGMPPQKVVVVVTDLTRAVVVTQLVVVRLRERNTQEADR